MKSIIPIKIVSKSKYNDMNRTLSNMEDVLNDIEFLLDYANGKNPKPIKLQNIEVGSIVQYRVKNRIIYFRKPINKLVYYINKQIRGGKNGI